MGLLSPEQSHDDTLERQRQQVAAELQHLLLDVYARCGAQHPVFHHSGMVLRLTGLLTQGAGRAAAEWPSTTQPTQVGSFSQQPSRTCLSPALSIAGLQSSPRSPPFLNHPPSGVRSPDFGTSTLLSHHQSMQSASQNLSHGLHQRRVWVRRLPPYCRRSWRCHLLHTLVPCRTFPRRRIGSILWFSSRLATVLIVDPSQSTLAQCQLKQLNARVPELRVVPLGPTQWM